MAAKEISVKVKKYVVRLSGEERERLEMLIRKGKSPARRVLKAEGEFRDDMDAPRSLRNVNPLPQRVGGQRKAAGSNDGRCSG